MTTHSNSAWSFTGPTAPFYDSEGVDPARFVFVQVDDDTFTVDAGVRYDDGQNRVTLSPDTPLQTDLASIPLFMAWFVPVNGRHTPAALVHDKLVSDARRLREEDPTRGAVATQMRADADAVFLSAMASCDVPLLRRRIMHSAVTVATRLSGSPWARVAIVSWMLASVMGTVSLLWALATRSWPEALVAAFAPVPGALLWGRRDWGAGVLAGYVLWLVAAPALVTAIAYSVYWSAEQMVRVVAARGGHTRVADVPKPAPYR